MVKNRTILSIFCGILLISSVQSKGGGGRGRGRSGTRGGRGQNSGSGGFWGDMFGGKSAGAHSYPASKGLSGHGTGSHRYPPSSGMSGNNRQHRVNSNYGRAYVPTYYSSPQYMYVNQYRQSGGRYNTLLTGLILYNLGRSNSHYYHHYYYDDYYMRRYGSNPQQQLYEKPEEHAACSLKITENESVVELKIPCEIVSTFTQDSQAQDAERINCTEISTISVDENSTNVPENMHGLNDPRETSDTPQHLANALDNEKSFDPTDVIPAVSPEDGTITDTPTTEAPVEPCITSNGIDPASADDSPLNVSSIQCTVEIRTDSSILQNMVDCKKLISYATLPEPKKDTGILPSRDTLKSWFRDLPWWWSVLIAV